MDDRRKKILAKLAQSSDKGVDKKLGKFADEISSEIKKAKDNDEIYERLELLKVIANNTPKQVLGAAKSVIHTKTKHLPRVKRYKFIGNIPGKDYSSLIVKCIEILDKIRYQETIEVFKSLCFLANNQDEKIVKKSLESLDRLGEYNLNVLQKIGYIPQTRLLSEIKTWASERQRNNLVGILEILRKSLQPEYQGGSMKDFKTYVYSFGALAVNDRLKTIRNEAINLLQKLYASTNNVSEQLKIISTFEEASRTPHSAKYGEDFEDMVRGNVRQTIGFYTKIIPTANNEVVKKIEHQFRWFKSRFKDVNDEIKKPQSIIDRLPEYKIYNCLTGEIDLLDGETNWEAREKKRNGELVKFVSGINQGNLKEWQKRIFNIIQNSIDLGGINGIQYFIQFLKLFGESKPGIALKLIEKSEDVDRFAGFISHLLAGLLQSNGKILTLELLEKYAGQKKRVLSIFQAFDFSRTVNLEIIQKAYTTAKKANDVSTIQYLTVMIVNQFLKDKRLVETFLAAIKFLSSCRKADWPKMGWYKVRPIITALNAKGHDIVLKNLIYASDIDYEIEEVLLPIAEKTPTKVVNFFKSRVAAYLKRASKQHIFSQSRYDAIPFDFHKINEPLSKAASAVIPQVLSWNKEKDSFYQWCAGEFLNKIFPNFNPDIEKEIIKLIRKGGDAEAHYVFYLLRPTNGYPPTHKVIQEFIKKFPHNVRYRNELFTIMAQTGIVTGEYGFVEAYKQKKEEVRTWKKSTSKYVRDFAIEYEKYMNGRIASEKKRADEDIELRKKEYEG